MIPLRWWGVVGAVVLLALLLLSVPGPPGPLQVRQTGDVSDLMPGERRELVGVIDNPGGVPRTTSQLSAAVTGTSHPACGPEFFVIEGSPLAVDLTVPPGPDQAAWSGLLIALLPEAAAREACQGVEATIDYALR
ncbi:hypothetical protein [Arenivirga flava]|uniref:Uncharacterized protein n=1 Tax=Arenivirga flava TaxID=1930060 RepID=A0AA37UL01_9MICO|nr:hypothetical protein [Arenivirga flava]GMA28377.1 hypothetical protein GCM10025874_16300 [Arenivirga flava]